MNGKRKERERKEKGKGTIGTITQERWSEWKEGYRHKEWENRKEEIYRERSNRIWEGKGEVKKGKRIEFGKIGSRMVRASGCQCRCLNSPGFDPSGI